MNAAPELEQSPVSIGAGTDAELLAQMIHDIKNPLSAILCYAEIVPEAKEGDRREYCDRLQANARAVLDLLDGFGLLVVLRSGGADTMVEAFDWIRQVMRVATDLHPVAAFRSQRIACDTVGERLIHGDRSKLTVAIRSLLLEGLRVAAPGETVELRVRAANDDAVLQVALPADRDVNPITLFDGSRPALELVERIAALHHGTLEFHQEPNRMVATLRIPLS